MNPIEFFRPLGIIKQHKHIKTMKTTFQDPTPAPTLKPWADLSGKTCLQERITRTPAAGKIYAKNHTIGTRPPPPKTSVLSLIKE